MTDVLTTIGKLRRFASEAHPPGSDAEMVATCLRDYLDGAAAGRALEQAFGIASRRSGERWWVVEARLKRDAALRSLASMFDLDSVNSQARRILNAARRYRGGRWKRDCDSGALYHDPRDQALYQLLQATNGALPSERTVRAVLSVGSEIGDFMASDSWSTAGGGD